MRDRGRQDVYGCAIGVDFVHEVGRGGAVAVVEEAAEVVEDVEGM